MHSLASSYQEHKQKLVQIHGSGTTLSTKVASSHQFAAFSIQRPRDELAANAWRGLACAEEAERRLGRRAFEEPRGARARFCLHATGKMAYWFRLIVLGPNYGFGTVFLVHINGFGTHLHNCSIQA